MAEKENNNNNMGDHDPTDQFPIGMRVLAVDDDPICLKILEALLQKCQYHVTATKQAVTALQLLRENKDQFDLVISDVHMPDMDGFKLLELVGLEMDLPVIMLSVNGDPKMVRKGITHGACDYLLKPVRVEELQNIWQHVIRKKKTVPKEGTKTSNQDALNSDGNNGQGSAPTTSSDQNGKLSKKRKDHGEDDDEEDEHENGNDSDDPSAPKKARVVWSVELHRKFVAAVNNLSLEKAVPKKILEMMNEENLTRENVASHLQKYRLYLKRISCDENQQANMAAALGIPDLSYLRFGSLGAVGQLQALNGSQQFHNNNAVRSFTPDGMISRMNTPSGVNVNGLLSSSGTLQLVRAQSLNNSTNGQLNFPSPIIGRNQNGIQLQHGVSHITNLNNLTDANTQAILVPVTNQRPSGLSISNNGLMLEANGAGMSTPMAPQHSQFSHPLLDNGRLNDVWSNALHSSGKYSYSPNERFGPASTPHSNNMNPSGASSITSLSSLSPDSLIDMHFQSQGVTFTNTPGHIRSNVPLQGWENQNQNCGYNSCVIGNSMGPMIPTNGDIVNSAFNYSDPLQMKHDVINQFTQESSMTPHQVHVMNQQKTRQEIASAMMMKQNPEIYGLLFSNNYPGGAPQ